MMTSSPSLPGRTGWFALLATDVDGLHVQNANFSVTRDGLDIVGCKHVLVENSSVTGGGDDAIVLKSDWSIGRELAVHNVTVRDIVAGSLGNNCMQIGSETIGNFSDLLFERIECIYSGKWKTKNRTSIYMPGLLCVARTAWLSYCMARTACS